MILKNIILPPVVLANLFKHSIVQMPDKTDYPEQQLNGINFLGGNKKNILVMVNEAEAVFLKSNDLSFLSGILKACNLSMEDVAVVNISRMGNPSLKDTADILNAETVIAAAIEPSLEENSFAKKEFKIHSLNDKKFVFIPALNIIQTDIVLKRKLWDLLKILFSV